MIAVDKIIDYESGEMPPSDVIAMFAELVASGEAWQLQGHYGRSAVALIESGVISDSGEILMGYDEERKEFVPVGGGGD